MRASAVGMGGVRQTPTGWRLTAPAPKGAGLRVEGPWDWSGARAVLWDMRADSNARIRVTLEHAGGTWVFYLVPKPGLRLRVVICAGDLRVRPANTAQPGYFTFGGGPDPVDLAAVRALTWTYDQDGPPAGVVLENLRATTGTVRPELLEAPPSVDAYGQWIGAGGVPRSAVEIEAAWVVEEHGPGDWPERSRWGGDGRWRLEATGRFRVDRFRDRWCLVDPDGHPFFSVGPNAVRPHAEGPLAGREALFVDSEAVRDRSGGADCYGANVRRRYGPSPDAAWGAAAQDRLRRWGFNTVANWSDNRLCAGGSLPWVTGLRGLDAWCHALPDVFSPAFSAQAEAAVEAELRAHAADPALVGYFVGNEPVWTFPGALHPFRTIFGGQHPHTAAAALAWLRERYGGDLAALGAAWRCPYASWEDLSRAGPPDPRGGPPRLRVDADAFAGRILERFYGVCCRAVRTLDPGRLLLGARFYSLAMPEPYLRACAAFDVVSFNCYRRVPPPEAVAHVATMTGRPALIGEFHFGVCGRGMSGALVTVPDDAARGEAYAGFVRAAAADPALVGAHWFQWADEPVTGRHDGEDYNIGLVDVTDLPYAGLVGAAERVHREMYRLRFGE